MSIIVSKLLNSLIWKYCLVLVLKLKLKVIKNENSKRLQIYSIIKCSIPNLSKKTSNRGWRQERSQQTWSRRYPFNFYIVYFVVNKIYY